MSSTKPDFVSPPPDESAAKNATPIGALIASISDDDDRLPKRPYQWLALMAASALVGVFSGLMGGAFRLVLTWFDAVRTAMLLFAHSHFPAWAGWLMPTALCSLGAAAGSWLTQRLAPQTAGSGIPRVEAVLRTHLRPAKGNILLVKFVGGALSIGSGLALGREVPPCKWAEQSVES
jgi:CIC family chloride channel protein